jgi:hypothetical protein
MLCTLPFERKKHTSFINSKTNLSSQPTMANNFEDERPLLTTVYFEQRDHLNQHTEYLHRLGLITLRNGGPVPELTIPIAIAIARKVGWNATNYEVYECGLGHYIVICLCPNNKDNVARFGPYHIPNYQIDLDHTTFLIST